MSSKAKKALLVGVAGSNNAFSLSLYNLKGYAYADPEIRTTWDIRCIQHPLVNILKHDAKLEELTSKIALEKPDLVGFSCYMWNVNFFHDLSKRLRPEIPDAKIVFGGPEMATDYLLQGKYNDFAMDFCVSGEGELTFVELLRALIAPPADFRRIQGLSFRGSGEKAFVVNDKRQPFKSLSEVPSPYLAGVVDDEVLFRSKVEANIETQRGCTLRCSYCIYHKDMNK